jgi:hypothetical protein
MLKVNREETLLPMVFDEEDAKSAFTQAQRSEKDKKGKYKLLPRNRRTEAEIKKIFDFGTEIELVRYLAEHGLPDGSEKSQQLVKLFREHAGKRQ